MATVLLIDDDEQFRRLCCMVLGGRGHQVFEVSRCSYAERLIPRREPNLIVLEANLPEGDGLAWVRKQRAAGMKVPVLLVSATRKPLRGQKSTAEDPGVEEFLAKPTSATTLAAKVDRLLRGSKPGLPAATLDALLPPEEARALEEMRAQYGAHLPRLIGGLHAAIDLLQQSPRDAERIVAARQLARHLAGMAGSFGFDAAGEVCAGIEEALIAMQAGDLSALATIQRVRAAIASAA